MQNSMVKQVIIIILAGIAILLALALIFYQYIPSNKLIPAKVEAYSMPENIKSEISDSTQQELNGHVETYEVTDTDLDMYRSSKSYNPGKSDPFSSYSVNSTNVVETNATSGTTVVENSSNKPREKAVDKNTTDNYYTSANVSKGTK